MKKNLIQNFTDELLSMASKTGENVKFAFRRVVHYFFPGEGGLWRFSERWREVFG